MWFRRITNFILQGRWQGIGLAFVCAFIPLVGSISILISGLVTLCKGPFEGALVVCAASIPALLTYFLMPSDLGYLTAWMTSVIVLSNLLTWFFTVLLYRTASWSIVLNSAILLSVLSIGIVHGIFPTMENWWETHLTTYFEKINQESEYAAEKSSVPAITEPERKEQAALLKEKETERKESQSKAIFVLKKYATGLFTLFLLLNVMLQVILSRFWQAIVFNPGGLRKELQQIEINYFSALIFIVGVLFSYFGNAFFTDTLPVFYGLFAIAGLSLLHYWVHATQKTWIWLLILYSAVFLLFPFSIGLLAVVALLDVGLHFRIRLSKPA